MDRTGVFANLNEEKGPSRKKNKTSATVFFHFKHEFQVSNSVFIAMFF